MAKNLKNPSKIISLTIFFVLFPIHTANSDKIADSFSRKLSPKELGLKREKLTHLHFYFHDIVSGRNPTTVKVAGPPLTANPSASFGFVAIVDDPLTVGLNLTSKKIGSAQGLYASASQSELGLLMVLNYVFTEGEYNGSTLSILGRNAIFSDVREMPIVGGSGVFRFARGYAQARTHPSSNVETRDAVVEYNVYVLHY